VDKSIQSPETSESINRVEMYTSDEIVPIPAQCKGPHKHNWTGRDAIRAPSLGNCCCFWCGAPLRPHPDYPAVIDAATRRRMQRSQTPRQLTFAQEAGR
jgi:hypothetical protein